ncbi:hypothetical protein FRB99_005394 [Tulasnella sp. 403]|nr:hypothetical protein FRB99_005394 [Tulasnella sp. 403]
MATLPPELIDVLKYRQDAYLIICAASALLLYDVLLTLDEEIKYISVGMAITSIYALTNDSPPVCKWTMNVEAYVNQGVIAIVQAMMLVRVYAIYRRSQILLVILCALWLACLAATSTLYTLLIQVITWAPNSFHGYLNICNIQCETCHGHYVNIYTPILVFDLVIVLLTLYRGYVSSSERSLAPTITLMYQDGVMYFLVIFSVVLVNVLFLWKGPAQFGDWWIPFMRTLMSSMASRLLLNLHYQMRLGTRTTLRSDVLAADLEGLGAESTDVRFAHPGSQPETSFDSDERGTEETLEMASVRPGFFVSELAGGISDVEDSQLLRRKMTRTDTKMEEIRNARDIEVAMIDDSGDQDPLV